MKKKYDINYMVAFATKLGYLPIMVSSEEYADEHFAVLQNKNGCIFIIHPVSNDCGAIDFAGSFYSYFVGQKNFFKISEIRLLLEEYFTYQENMVLCWGREAHEYAKI